MATVDLQGFYVSSSCVKHHVIVDLPTYTVSIWNSWWSFVVGNQSFEPVTCRWIFLEILSLRKRQNVICQSRFMQERWSREGSDNLKCWSLSILPKCNFSGLPPFSTASIWRARFVGESFVTRRDWCSVASIFFFIIITRIGQSYGREVIIKIILHEFILTYETFKIIMYWK